jgi:glycosyltransferase involved in cell wall biosynthesis
MPLKVSVIVRCRNEYPIILNTINMFLNEIELHGFIPEIIVVDNMSDDSGADILEDRFRRWVRHGILKVVRYDEKPSTWNAINAGYEHATGDVIFVADAHVSLKIGSLKYLVDGILEHKGLWHSAVQLWGDTERIKRYQYDIRLAERFWGDACQFLPPGEDGSRPYEIPLAGACLFGFHPEEARDFSLYDEAFGTYGGGEPYLCMKWWMYGSKVWIDPRSLCRHAFGLKPRWVKVNRRKTTRNLVYTRGGELKREMFPPDEFLAYNAGYRLGNLEFYWGFMLAAYLLGGSEWLDHIFNKFCQKNRDHGGLRTLYKEVIECGEKGRAEITSRQKISLNELIANPPWKSCGKHEVNWPDFITP